MEQDYGYDGLKAAKKVLLATSFDNAKRGKQPREKQPLAIILGGQPASGKTQLFVLYPCHIGIVFLEFLNVMKVNLN